MNMGIVQRVEKLINADHVTDDEAATLFESMKTLVLPEAMGKKFKVLMMSHPELSDAIPGSSPQIQEST
jgi:SAM-dependent MidA family methyltransferase